MNQTDPPAACLCTADEDGLHFNRACPVHGVRPTPQPDTEECPTCAGGGRLNRPFQASCPTCGGAGVSRREDLMDQPDAEARVPTLLRSLADERRAPTDEEATMLHQLADGLPDLTAAYVLQELRSGRLGAGSS